MGGQRIKVDPAGSSGFLGSCEQGGREVGWILELRESPHQPVMYLQVYLRQPYLQVLSGYLRYYWEVL